MVSFGNKITPVYMVGWAARVVLYHNILKKMGMEETFIESPRDATKDFVKKRIQRVQCACQPVFKRISHVASSFYHEPVRYPLRQAYRPLAAAGRRGRQIKNIAAFLTTFAATDPVTFIKFTAKTAKEELGALKGRISSLSRYVQRKADQGGHIWTYVDRTMGTGEKVSKLLKTVLTIEGFKTFVGRMQDSVGKSVIRFDKVARFVPVVALPILALSMTASGAGAIKGVLLRDKEIVIVNLLELKIQALDFGANVVGFAQMIIAVAGLQEVAFLSQVGAPIGMAIAGVRILMGGWFISQNLLFLHHLHKNVDPLFKGQRPHLKDHLRDLVGPDEDAVAEELLKDPNLQNLHLAGEALDFLGNINYPSPNRDELRDKLIEFLQQSIALTPKEESKLTAQNERIFARKKNQKGKEAALERLKGKTIHRKRLRIAYRGKGKTVKEMEKMLIFLEGKKQAGVTLTERDVIQLEKGMNQVKSLVKRRLLGNLIGITSAVLAIVGFGLLYSGYGAIASLVLFVVSAALLLFELFYDDFLVTLGLSFPTYGKASLIKRFKERLQKLDVSFTAWFEKWKDHLPPPVYEKAMGLQNKLHTLLDKLYRLFVVQGVQRAARAFRAKKTAFYSRLVRCHVVQVPFRIKLFLKSKFNELKQVDN